MKQRMKDGGEYVEVEFRVLGDLGKDAATAARVVRALIESHDDILEMTLRRLEIVGIAHIPDDIVDVTQYREELNAKMQAIADAVLREERLERAATVSG